MAAETPCSVLYNDIRSFGGLKHLEIARMLINGNSYLGSTLLEKCSSNRSYLTRYIVHREPDQCAPAIYSDFAVTTLNLSAAICSKLGGGESVYQAIAEHYRGPAANEMMSALASYKLDSRLYANALNHIDNLDGNAVREKSTLYLMLFVATGALADPIQGVATVERFCDSKTGGHFGTTETTVGRGFMSSLEQPHAVAPQPRSAQNPCRQLRRHANPSPHTRSARHDNWVLAQNLAQHHRCRRRRIARASPHLARRWTLVRPGPWVDQRHSARIRRGRRRYCD